MSIFFAIELSCRAATQAGAREGVSTGGLFCFVLIGRTGCCKYRRGEALLPCHVALVLHCLASRFSLTSL
ncbi:MULTISPECIES: hypothetical protein [Rhodobacterales]|uniref:Uncharacterized protein n=1 Tax=Halocynthiibacter styelae TaxID=2761955 RepID=A0A8J7IJF8_9RHOB|nr:MULTISPECIES: hypothetical protein [Rhodobacterales]MBI1494183.1 hypothetical protein [Paenihalocynthiibacter styelae]